MERESFENEEIAALLNREYICVKVDREERPDVDSVYMSVCQAMTGQGGWPLTIIMSPDCRPFFAGTYFPPRARYGRMGLLELLAAAAEKWKKDREKLLVSAGQIKRYLEEQEQRTVPAEPGMQTVHQAFLQFADSFDKGNGGFGGAPKFPAPHNLMFLMEYGVRKQNREALSMVETTLEQMYRGGIFDHIGGGFSRYSTDERWLVPHFEKMLYDNALLVLAYTKAYGLTGRRLYQSVVQRILGYVDAELTDTQGGFYCGQDADSDGVEGKYYVFTPKEVMEVLGKKAGTIFCRQYGITVRGNFEGKSIPNLLENDRYEELSETQEKSETAGSSVDLTKEDYKKLYDYRIGRTRLHKDDKILVSWNGWMICACAEAGAVFGEKRYVDMAIRGEGFLCTSLVKMDRLLVRYRDGDAVGEGKLDDYAAYVLALLKLYQVTFKTGYLKRAATWAKVMAEQFFDQERGGFYLYAKDGEQLIVRTKETYDGAMPSGNSTAARVLQLLVQITGEIRWQSLLEKQLHYLAGSMEGYPSGHCYALLTMMNVLYPAKELVCTISPSCAKKEYENLKAQLGYLSMTVPGLAVVVKTQENEKELSELAPYTGEYPLPASGMQFYLCSGSKCMPPVPELSQLMEHLKA